jgi:hypothetical protein
MARAVGISETSVRRIWHSHGLKPEFARKLEDIVDLYLHPPEHALVLCVDAKSHFSSAGDPLGVPRRERWFGAACGEPDHAAKAAQRVLNLACR